MPCYTVQINRVDMPKMNAAMRGRALVAMGATVHGSIFTLEGRRYYFSGAKLESQDADYDQVQKVAGLLKRHYSDQVVRYTAQRNGWKLKQTAPFQYEVIK
jgi:hypothetical protein